MKRKGHFSSGSHQNLMSEEFFSRNFKEKKNFEVSVYSKRNFERILFM